ncbi:MAG: hypothetical protein SVY41_03565 [Candidatus Nanohaloarchaea archaeon]|nr:hypothetical protein [Candidatus Nanohaloarchaea archaeon]
MNLQRLRGAAEPVDLAVIAVLSLVATVPLFLISPSIDAVVAVQPPLPVSHLVILLLVLPLPAAYVAAISGERFRVESLAAVITLPFALAGPRFTAFSVGLVLGLPLVSYKARNLFHGDNRFWTSFKASAALITVLALVTGVIAVQAYSGSAAVQNAVQGNVTAVAVDTATGFVDVSGGSTSMMTGMAAGIAVNTSRTTVAATERTVFTAVNRSDGFSPAERQVLRAAFTEAEEQIPPQVGQQAQKQVQQRLAQQTDVGEEVLASRVAPIVDTVTAPEPPVLAVLFLTVASLVYIFRLPVGVVAAVYVMLGRRVNRAVSSGSEEPETRRDRRQQP